MDMTSQMVNTTLDTNFLKRVIRKELDVKLSNYFKENLGVECLGTSQSLLTKDCRSHVRALPNL